MTGTARLRRRLQAAVDELGLSGPITNDAIKSVLEERRGRPIHIETAPAEMFAHVACGVWWETANVDVILIPDDVDPMLMAHTVRHEFAHMILRHQGTACGQLAMEDVLRRLMPDLDPGKVLAMLARTDFTGYAEREAEMLASMLTLRASDGDQVLANPEAEALRLALAVASTHG